MPSRALNELPVARRVDPNHVETISVLGPTIQFLTSPDDENGPCIMRGAIPPGGSVPLHSHADPETFILISGVAEGLVHEREDFSWVRIDPGDVFYVPGNAKHGWRNPGREPADMYVVSTSRIGRFFREVGCRVAPGSPARPPLQEEIARFLEVSRQYGYWNATPDENARVGISVPGI